jgi:Cys-tRNA(Pro) deacylase
MDLNKILVKNNLQTQTLPQSTGTAEEAAQALDCQLDQIAKSICFWADDQPLLVIASGVNRINEQTVAKLLGVGEVSIMDPDEVQKETGYAVGGVPPFGHQKEIKTLIDKDLMQFDKIWAAAGSPHSVFDITPKKLKKITSGQVVKIK